MPALPRLLRISSLLVAGALLYVGWQRLVDAAFAPVTELDEIYPYRDDYLDQIHNGKSIKTGLGIVTF